MSNFLLAILIGLTTLFSKPLEAAQSENRSTQQAISESGLLFTQAKKLLDSGDPKAAIPLFERSLEICQNSLGPQHRTVASNLQGLGNSYYLVADYAKAIPLYKRALAIDEKTLAPDHPNVANNLYNLANAYQEMGDYAKAIPMYERALAIDKKTLAPQHPNVVAAWRGLGGAYQEMGNYAKAIEMLGRALAIDERTLGPEHPNVAGDLQNLGNTYYLVADYAKAIPMYERALAINEKALGPQHPNLAGVLVGLGNAYKKTLDVAKAIEMLGRALAIDVKTHGPEHPNVAGVLQSLGGTYLLISDYAKASEMLGRALAIDERTLGPEHPNVAKDLQNLGNTYYLVADYAKAIPIYERALAIDVKTHGPEHPNVAGVLQSLGKTYSLMGNLINARAITLKWAASRENSLQLILNLGEEQRLAWTANFLDLDLPAMTLNPNKNDELILRWKSIVLDSLLEDRAMAKTASTSEKGKSSLNKIQSLKSQIAKLAISSGRIDTVQIQRLQSQIDSLEYSLAQNIHLGGRVRDSAQVSLGQLQANLSDGDAVLDFIGYNDIKTISDCYGISILTRGGDPKFLQIEGAKEINDALEASRKNIAYGDEAALKKNYAIILKKLWKPLAATLPQDTKKLYIGADGPINFLSFATLQDDQGKFLSETYQIAYVGSGRDLLRPAKPIATKSMVIYANPDFTAKVATKTLSSDTIVSPNRQKRPAELAEFSKVQLPQLPGTEQEAAMVSQIAKDSQWSEETHLGTDASKKELMAMKAPAVLHLATHGFFMGGEQSGGEGERGMKLAAAPDVPTPAASTNPKPLKISPMRQSGVALTGGQSTIQAWGRGEFPDPSNDGILTAEEVAGLDLDGTWLVTLSACETGVGQVQSGEGVFGLRRAFMMAGAQNLLMTLWPVSDEVTPKIMADFYKEALATHDAAGSLSDVQRDWLVKLRKEKGLLAAVRDAGPFAMVMMANPNAKPMPESSAKVSTTTSRPEAPPSTVSSSESISADSTVSPNTSEGGKVIEFNDALARAIEGDAYAQAVVSIYYGLGYKSEKDFSKAAEYASKSSAQNNPLGQYQLGVLTAGGEGVEKDQEKGKSLKVQSTEGLNSMPNDPYALAALGSMAIRGEGVSKNMKKAANFYRKSADLGYAPAQLIYSAMLANGAGVILDAKKAKIYHQKALEQNYNP